MDSDKNEKDLETLPDGTSDNGNVDPEANKGSSDQGTDPQATPPQSPPKTDPELTPSASLEEMETEDQTEEDKSEVMDVVKDNKDEENGTENDLEETPNDNNKETEPNTETNEENGMNEVSDNNTQPKDSPNETVTSKESELSNVTEVGNASEPAIDDLLKEDIDVDIKDLEGQDPQIIEQKKLQLIEYRNRLLDYLENLGEDPTELLTLGVKDKVDTTTVAQTPTPTRRRSKRHAEVSSTRTPRSSKRAKTSRRSSRITQDDYYTETTPIAKQTPPEGKRGRITWSLEENRLLLTILEKGKMDSRAIYDEMSKSSLNQKTLEHIRNKKSNLTQKASSRGISITDVLREDISKILETDFSFDRAGLNRDQFNQVTAQLDEIKQLVVSGITENQKQIALLRRDFSIYRGQPIPDDVSEILSNIGISNDEMSDTSEPPSVSKPKKTLVIKKRH